MTTYKHPLQDIHLKWLPCNPSIHLTSTTSSTVNIHPYLLPTFTNPTLPSPSEAQVLKKLASSNLSQGSRFTATILPHDSQSFVTDSPQTWPTQPQSPRLPTPAINFTTTLEQRSNASTQISAPSDFVLFPTVSINSSPHASHACRSSERARATSITAPNQYVGQTHDGLQSRSNTTHHRQLSSSVAPIQNQGVSGIIYGTGSRSSSQSIQQHYIHSPTEQQQPIYANSAPSSTTVLHQQSPRSRPLVPLFAHNRTSNHSQQNPSMMAHSPHAEGTLFFEEAAFGPESTLTTSPSEPASHAMIGYDGYLTPAPIAPLDGYSYFGRPNSFPPINHPASVGTSNPDTVSPQEIMLSAPPSGALSNFNTPATSVLESPYPTYNSTDTSPFLRDESFGDGSFGEESNSWAPMNFFPTLPGATGDAPSSDYNVPEQTTHMTPPMSRNASIEYTDDTATYDNTRGPQTSHVTHPMSRNTSSSHIATPLSRKASSPSQGQASRQSSRQSSQQGPRRSSTSGVTKPRRRAEKLPPIAIGNPRDETEVRRARNTMAARKSREKRLENVISLETENAELKERVEHYRDIALNLGHIE